MRKKTKKMWLDILHYYLLALWLLLGYYVAALFGITGENGWAFAQPLYVMIPVLTLFYGTWLIPGDKFIHWMLGV